MHLQNGAQFSRRIVFMSSVQTYEAAFGRRLAQTGAGHTLGRVGEIFTWNQMLTAADVRVYAMADYAATVEPLPLHVSINCYANTARTFGYRNRSH